VAAQPPPPAESQNGKLVDRIKGLRGVVKRWV
jgi:hypothetical protein